jgi:hypothetical protein
MYGRLAGVRCPFLLPGKLYDGLSISKEAHGVGSGSEEGLCIKFSWKRAQDSVSRIYVSMVVR